MPAVSTFDNLRILRFSTDHCGACKAQKKALIVERFKDEYPHMKLVELVCAADESELKDLAKKAAYEFSETYEVQSFPTLVVECRLPNSHTIELFRVEGQVTLAQLKKMADETILARNDGPGWN